MRGGDLKVFGGKAYRVDGHTWTRKRPFLKSKNLLRSGCRKEPTDLEYNYDKGGLEDSRLEGKPAYT